MIHGTTDRLRTWCMDEVVAVDGWSLEADSVECIECLRRQHDSLREENARLRAELARVVEAGNHLRGFAAGTDLGKAYIADWDAAAKGE